MGIPELACPYLVCRLCDQDILQEAYEELLHEKAKLEAEKEHRRNFGMDLDHEDLHFLLHFEETIELARRELKEVSEDVERLKQLCIEKGLMDAAENPELLRTLRLGLRVVYGL